MDDFGDRLKEMRGMLKLTQSQLAEKVGSSAAAFGQYEKGEKIPGGKVLAGLARLGVNINWLLTGEDQVFISALKFDLELLQDVMAVMEKVFDNLQEQHEMMMYPDKKAKWIAFFYEEFMGKAAAEKTKEKVEEKIYRFLELSTLKEGTPK